MEQLRALDAGFLHAEDADRHVSLAIGGLAVIEGPVPDRDALMSTFAQRVAACPRFAQRLRRHRFDLGAPEWVDAPGFDLAHHVRRVAVPHPGDDAALRQLVADVMSWRLDRDRPLWEIWVIEGLADNRWAMLTKVHHCMADGIAATHMLAGLCDGGVDDSVAPHVGGTGAGKSGASSATGLSLNPLKLAGGLWNTSAAIAAGAFQMAQGVAELAVGLARPAPSSTLNGPVSNLRRYSAARVSMHDVVAVCQRFGVTVNDVALAAITESYRDMLIRHGERPRAQSLRALVPVSTRAVDARYVTDNRVSVMLPYLPVDEDNPVQRLEKVNARLGRTKSHGQRQAGSAFVSAANRIPFPVTAWSMRLLTRLPQRGVVTLATNVPGPRQPLRIMGHKVLSVFPVPPIAMNLRTGVAMLSYVDDLFFGILADYETIPDSDALARGIEAAVARLAAHSKRFRASRDHGRLTLVHTA
jgi:diacylglycerol O-acyltransferase / wax synthase